MLDVGSFAARTCAGFDRQAFLRVAASVPLAWNLIVYTAFAGPKLLRLMRLKAGTSTPLHPAASKSEFEPAFSRDGRCLAFVQLRGVLSLALMIHDLERNETGEVPPASGFAGMRSPAIAPDLSRIVFSFAQTAHQKLFCVDKKGNDYRPLTEGVGIDNWPAFSPDGRTIVFGSSRQGTYDLFVMNADGKNVRRLTEGKYRHVRPEFSPDGRRIAFARFEAGRMRVCVMDADGRGARVLPTGSEGDDYPTWHPDGGRLLVVSQWTGRQDLYEVAVDDR